MMAVEMANRQRWSTDPSLDDWRAASRLDGFAKRLRSIKPGDTEVVADLQRYAATAARAMTTLQKLLASADVAT